MYILSNITWSVLLVFVSFGLLSSGSSLVQQTIGFCAVNQRFFRHFEVQLRDCGRGIFSIKSKSGVMEMFSKEVPIVIVRNNSPNS